MSSNSLTRGEALLIHRRRKGWNQTQAAKHHKVTRQVYSNWELDAGTIPQPKRPILGHTELHERLLIERRRLGLSQADVATKIGCCRHQIMLMEAGQADAKRLADLLL